MIVYRIEKYDGYYQGEHDDKPKDHFLYFDGDGSWTAKIQEACQFTSWGSANNCSKFLTNAVITQSNTNPKVYPDYDGDRPKQPQKVVSATLAARRAAERLHRAKSQGEKQEKVKQKADGLSVSEKIRRMAQQGMAIKDITKELNVRYQLVYQVVKKMDSNQAAAGVAAA